MAAHTYSPKDVDVIVAGVSMNCFAEDSIVSIAYAEDAWTMVSGADGCVSRSKNPNRSGTISVSLQTTSDSNDVLSALYFLDYESNVGTFPVLVKDNNGTTVASGADCWIMKIPDSELAREVGTVEWVIQVPELYYFRGGNVA